MDNNSYERINDTVYILSPEIKLLFSVVLAYKAKNNSRVSYHNEYEYDKGGDKVITIRREASCFLSFRIANSEDILIYPQHFIKFYSSLESCKRWFDGSCQVFYTKNNKLYVPKDLEAAKPIYISELAYNKWITIEPKSILTDEGRYSPGVRMCFNNQIITDINVDKFYGLIHVLTGFNMYTNMSLLLNYVNTCTPGTNLSRLGNNNSQECVDNSHVSGVNGRTQRKKSIFER